MREREYGTNGNKRNRRKFFCFFPSVPFISVCSVLSLRLAYRSPRLIAEPPDWSSSFFCLTFFCPAGLDGRNLELFRPRPADQQITQPHSISGTLRILFAQHANGQFMFARA